MLSPEPVICSSPIVGPMEIPGGSGGYRTRRSSGDRSPQSSHVIMDLYKYVPQYNRSDWCQTKRSTPTTSPQCEPTPKRCDMKLSGGCVRIGDQQSDPNHSATMFPRRMRYDMFSIPPKFVPEDDVSSSDGEDSDELELFGESSSSDTSSWFCDGRKEFSGGFSSRFTTNHEVNHRTSSDPQVNLWRNVLTTAVSRDPKNSLITTNVSLTSPPEPIPLVETKKTNLHHSGGGITNEKVFPPERPIQIRIDLPPTPIDIQSKITVEISDGLSRANPSVSVNLTTSQSTPCTPLIAVPQPISQLPSLPCLADPLAQLPQQPQIKDQHGSLSDTDVARLQRVGQHLKETGWYYGPISCQEAASYLQREAVGTFLLRDSNDPHFLYSLSVQTPKGPTSVRIHYRSGSFILDAEDHLLEAMPRFRDVVELVEHYVKMSERIKKMHVWVKPDGSPYSPVRLTHPLLKSVPTLQHLCRLTINRLDKNIVNQVLPKKLCEYVSEYPFSR